VGLFGLMGSGRSELGRLIFGLDGHCEGTVRLGGGEPYRPSPRASARRGLAFLTESRRDDGLCLEASVADNLALSSLNRFARWTLGLLDRGRLRASLDLLREAIRLDARVHLDRPVKTLSGGNQQKVVLGKWLLARPRVLILDEPTRGIDVGARSEIYELIVSTAEGGSGVLLISSEIEELLGLCDKVLVFRRGEIVDRLPREEFDRERILRAALGMGTVSPSPVPGDVVTAPEPPGGQDPLAGGKLEGRKG
jgi:ribose transport system ATP-binding protein